MMTFEEDHYESGAEMIARNCRMTIAPAIDCKDRFPGRRRHRFLLFLSIQAWPMQISGILPKIGWGTIFALRPLRKMIDFWPR